MSMKWLLRVAVAALVCAPLAWAAAPTATTDPGSLSAATSPASTDTIPICQANAGVCTSPGNQLVNAKYTTFGRGLNAVQTAKTATYAVANSDGFTTLNFNCATALCYATLPTSTSAVLALGTRLQIVNTSNAAAVPILPVGTPAGSSSCAATSCTSATEAYTIAGTAHGIVLTIEYCQDSGCSVPTVSPPHISSVTDTKSNSCALVSSAIAHGANGSGNSGSKEIWACYNTPSTGSDTFTMTASGTVWYLNATISEYSGMATSAAGEQGNSASGNGVSLASSVSLAATSTVEGDLIIGDEVQPVIKGTPAQRTVFTGLAGEFMIPNGAQAYTLNWTLSQAQPWVAVIAAFKPAAAKSQLFVCPNTAVTSTIAGTPTSTAMCNGSYGGTNYATAGVPVPPGATLTLVTDAANNYQASLSGVTTDIVDLIGTSLTPDLSWCYQTTGLLNYISAQTVTIPAGIPPPCNMGMIQMGSVAAQISAGTGMYPVQAVGNVHTGGIGAFATAVIGAGGGTFYMDGRTAQ